MLCQALDANFLAVYGHSVEESRVLTGIIYFSEDLMMYLRLGVLIVMRLNQSTVVSISLGESKSPSTATASIRQSASFALIRANGVTQRQGY